MKKNITKKELNHIGVSQSGAKWIRPFCVHSLEEVQSSVIKHEVKLGWFGYLLLFVPVHIFKFFWCIWDGGLKEFEIETRQIRYDYFYEADAPYCDFYKKAKEILERG